jgi:cell division protein FtsW
MFIQNKLNRLLITFSLLLLVVGLIALISASAVIGEQEYGDVYHFVKKQLLLGIFLGLILAWVASKINYRSLTKLSLILLILNIVLLLLCFIPALQPLGSPARRWLRVGPVNFQPSEFIKLTYILFLAGLLSRFSIDKRRKMNAIPFIIFVSTLAIIAFIIFQQPATGTLLVLGLSSISVYIVAGMSMLQFFSLGTTSILGLTFLIQRTSYRLQRILSFWSPESDPLGKGYHIIQSLIGIGSGGLFGIGFGRSIQKFNYLPESHTDAIFSIIAEEFGFLGSSLIIILFLILISIGLKIAKKAPDNLGKFLAIGLTCNIGFQAFINIAAMCKLLPITGIPLPFISYGPSSLVATLISLGILSNIAKQT